MVMKDMDIIRKKEKYMNNAIDIAITYVDNTEPYWQQ